MDYYRCENPNCGFLAGEEPDVCPRCGGTFFTPLLEEDLTGGDSLASNIQLVYNNARLAAKTAVELSKLN